MINFGDQLNALKKSPLGNFASKMFFQPPVLPPVHPNLMSYIVPDEGYKGAFKPENIDKYSFIPNNPGTSDISKLKKTGKANVNDIVPNEILNDPRFKNIKDTKVILTNMLRQDGEAVDGLYETKNNTITLKKGTPALMDKTLNHEIQHAIDKETGTVMYNNDKEAHDSRPQEQQALTNELLYEVERKLKGGATHDDVLKWFDTRAFRYQKQQDYVNRINMAKKLYQKWYDSRSEIV